MPPFHPPTVHFPIALLTLAVAADVAGYIFRSPSLRGTGWWGLFGGALGGVLAVASGLYDSRRPSIGPSVADAVNYHMKVGFAVLAALIVLALWRWKIHKSGRETGWQYLLLALAALALTLYQGWLGGELVYTYGVS